MTTRYFKATDGKITAFRASKTRVYQSADLGNENRHLGSRYGIGFSGKPGPVKAVEIDKAEYDRLVVLKNARLGKMQYGPSPQDSWVDNAAL